jgi:hypothetical protein
MGEELRVFVGVDWGESNNQVHVLGAGGDGQARSFPADGSGIAKMVDWLTSQCDRPQELGVAIEVPHGPVVEAVLDAAFAVYALNPKKVDRFRDRHSIAGAKDDRRDAWTLASALRTDPQAFQLLHPGDPSVVRLRESSRVLEDIKRESRRLANQLRGLLLRYHREPLKLVPAADEPWFWDVLETSSTPERARRLTKVRLRSILQKHRIRRFATEEVKAVLQGVALPVSQATVDACEEHVLLLLPRLRLLHEQRQRCDHRIQELLDNMAAPPAEADGKKREHRDVDILRSLPGAGDFVAATVLVESGTSLQERDYHSLRARAGTAPVTKQSGKTRQVSMRYARNNRLQQAVHYWAGTAILKDPPLRAIYDRLRARDASYARALRGVGDRLLQLLVVLLENDQLYDPKRRELVETAA